MLANEKSREWLLQEIETLKGRVEKLELIEAHQKLVEEELLDRNRELALLYKTSITFSATLDLNVILESILEEIRNLYHISASSVWLIDRETGELVCRNATGPKSETVKGWRLKLGEGIVGVVAESGVSQIVEDSLVDERHFKGVDEETGLVMRSIMSVPLKAHKEIIGVIQVLDITVGRFKETDLPLVESLASSAAISIDNARLYHEVQKELSARKITEEKLRILATTDDLTRLYNRRYFIELANREFKRAKRYGQSLSLLLFDADHFKDVNDTHGHDAGDRVLQTLAEIGLNSIRSIDILGRFGGEEFAAILPVTDLPKALYAAERLRAAVEKTLISIGEKSLSITISVGAASLTPEINDLQSLLKKADIAMYKAKENGRNQVQS